MSMLITTTAAVTNFLIQAIKKALQQHLSCCGAFLVCYWKRIVSSLMVMETASSNGQGPLSQPSWPSA